MRTASAVPEASTDVDVRQINSAHVKVYQLSKALLPTLREEAALLRTAKAQLGDAYKDWVTTQLPFSVEIAEGILRFADECLPATEHFSQAAGKPAGMLLARLERFCALLPPFEQEPNPEPSTGTDKNRISSCLSPGKGRDLSKNLPAGSASFDLTKENAAVLRSHSKKLYAQVKLQRITVDEALRQVQSSTQN